MEKIVSPLISVEESNPFFDEIKKGINCNADLGCCVFKKCCKKYKRGKRCKKCPKG